MHILKPVLLIAQYRLPVCHALKVLDLSFNMLTSLHPLMHLSLRTIGAEVMLAGNEWHCDCSLRSLRRRMVYDRNRGLKAWNVVCASPPILSGRALLQVEEGELNCFSTEKNAELQQDITVSRGSEILLSCLAEGNRGLRAGIFVFANTPIFYMITGTVTFILMKKGLKNVNSFYQYYLKC